MNASLHCPWDWSELTGEQCSHCGRHVTDALLGDFEAESAAAEVRSW